MQSSWLRPGIMIQNNLLPACISGRAILYLCLSAILFKSATAAYQLNYLDKFCDEQSDHINEYENSLNLLLSNLTAKSDTTKFYNYTAGENPYKLYGLFLCNGVHSDQVCQACIGLAAKDIQQKCPISSYAIVWYEGCMLRYANYSIFSVNDESGSYNLQGYPEKYSQFYKQVSDTFTSLFNKATTGNSSLMYATKQTSLARGLSVSCYVDCTPDISPSDCRHCLKTGLMKLQLDGSQAGRVLLQPSCRLTYDFLVAGPFSQANKVLGISLVIVSAVAAVSLLLNLFAYLKRRKAIEKPIGLDEIQSMENLHLEFESIKAATDNFSVVNKLGQGGFGVVYMGTLADGQAVAVKRLSNASGQGFREFKTEACLAAKLQHKNLVKLFGFCLEGDEMLLVYEFVANKSLDRFLFDPQRGVYLKWKTRYKIIVGIARGLLYLHEDSRPKIIHRDLKPSNILLDAELNPKIADFGMAKLFGGDQTQGNTSRIAGTFGYMAPEYATTGHFSMKSDIFSYGVIILEILSGLRNNGSNPHAQENLLNYAWRLWNEGTYIELVDSSLGSNFSKGEVGKCIHVGLLCIQEDPTKRPDIESVLLMLKTEPVMLPPPASPPPFPFRPEKRAASYRSDGVCAEDVITDLTPR